MIQEEYQKKMQDGYEGIRKMLCFKTKSEMQEMFIVVDKDHSVRIDAAAAPASPTAELLAQAVAYEAEQADDY